jgi:hypothetical protein
MGGVAKKPLDRAYEMGLRAFRKGIMDSPYKRTSVLHKEWERGFNTAFLKSARMWINRQKGDVNV